MNRIISIVLIVIGLGLGYAGIDKLENSRASLEIGGLEISAGDKSSTTSAYLTMGLGAICLIGGIVSLTKK